jgi:hypothetical protein
MDSSLVFLSKVYANGNYRYLRRSKNRPILPDGDFPHFLQFGDRHGGLLRINARRWPGWQFALIRGAVLLFANPGRSRINQQVRWSLHPQAGANPDADSSQ